MSATGPIPTRLVTAAVLIGWALSSAAVFAASWYIEPYLFAYASIAGVAVSLVLCLAVLIAAPRRLGLALLGAAPSVVAVLVMLGMHWA